MNLTALIVMALGAAIIVTGIALILAGRGDAGSAGLRFMGVEFNTSGGTGYLVFIAGVGMFLIPIFQPLPDLRAPSKSPPIVQEKTATTAAAPNTPVTAPKTPDKKLVLGATPAVTAKRKSPSKAIEFDSSTIASQNDPVRRWKIAQQNGLFFSDFIIEEFEMENFYIWRISGIYPQSAGSDISEIMTYGFTTSGKQVQSLDSEFSKKIKRGNPFSISYKFPKSALDSASSVFICGSIGNSCYPSPNLLIDRPRAD